MSELESKALQRLHSIEAAVEETDIHLSGNQSDKIWPEGILPEEEASPDPDTSLEGNTPLEEKPQKQRRELGKRAVVHKGPAPVELRSSSKLKEDLRQLASRRRSNRKELLAKIRHVRKENTALKAQVSRLRKAAKKQQEIRRQETTQSEEIGQLSGSPSLLSVVEARIEKRRALKAEVEKEIAEDRSLIQAQESEISKIEDTLAERGERDSGLPHPQRLEEKGQVLGRLQDLELQRREIAIAQADVLGMAQEEMGDQDRPERVDPSRQRESLEQLARRAKDAADQFRQKTEAVAEKARRTRDSEETITGSVERSQMRADLREIAQAEKNAREAFEKVFEKGPEARRQFAKEAHLEGVDERTWSYDRAHWQLATHPEEYGELTGPDVEDEGPNVGDEGPKSRALEAARAQQAVDKKRRAFRRTYDGRRPTRAAEDLLPDGDEARRVLPEMPTGRALSPEVRKAAAEDAKATAKNRIERWEEKFLENAQRKFTDKDQALQSFRENERICDVEVARGVLLEPSAYRDEEGSRLQDPGREWWSRERSKNRMKELGRKIQKQERRVRTLDQAANTAMIQQLEKRLQDGRVVVDPENRAPAPKQTTLSRVALRGVSGRDLPYVENDLYAEDDSPFDSAWEAFRGQIQDRRPSEKGWEATPIVKEARRTERCKAIRRDLDAAWSNDTSLQDQKRVLLGTLGRQGMELESAKNVLRQVEKGQEAAEAIRQVVGPQPAESDAPESVREAAETIASLDRESEKGRATRLIQEGVQTKNGVLREAGKLELIRSLHRSHSEEEDRRDEKIISRAAKLRERVGEWEARSPEPEDYDLRLKERLREMTEREQTLLERRASSDERVQEAVERAQSPGCVENQRRTTEKRRRSAGRTQSLPTEDHSRTTGTQSKRSQKQTDDNSQKKDQDENQQTTERQRDRGRDEPDRGRGGIGF